MHPAEGMWTHIDALQLPTLMNRQQSFCDGRWIWEHYKNLPNQIVLAEFSVCLSQGIICYEEITENLITTALKQGFHTLYLHMHFLLFSIDFHEDLLFW